MQRNEIVIARFFYIIAAILLIVLFIIMSETKNRAAVTVVYLPGDESAPLIVDPQLDEDDKLAYKELYDRIVYIDPGHGDVDPGATRRGYQEKDITMSIALMVYNMITEGDSGIFPIMSHDGSYTFDRYQRVAEGNLIADMFVSIHCNDLDNESDSISGAETYYDIQQSLAPSRRTSITSGELAAIIQRNIVERTGARDRGAKNQREYGYEFAITTGTTIPCVLAEVGFMSSPKELSLLVTEQYQRKIAEGIYYGILEAFGEND